MPVSTRTPRWTGRLIAAVIALPIAAVITAYGSWVLVDRRLTVITPGAVYQSAAMSPEKLDRVVTSRGIQTVFDFRGDADDSAVIRDERNVLEARNVRYIHLASSTVPDPATVDRFVRTMAAEVGAHRVVLLHCHDGQGRAVFYSAVYRMEFEGWDNHRAWQATTRLPPSLLFLTDWAPSVGRLSAANAKSAMILRYRPQLTPALVAGLAATPPL